ncbi:hypothetical protein I3842_07G119200 [Carya illinoinensis]|uniref:Uncharacterized protein n=1 Tax=Carya illinoinensis TaxID=32201 RepID=A0A922EJK2_CARIL|nr:hypothetical protein I3842_07G119200 [Carya illinoinensis]
MGNYVTYRPSDATGKVILSDGTVHQFDKPLTVAELMLEHSQHVVVELHSAVNEKRPIKRGRRPAALSSEEVRRILLTANSVLWRSRPSVFSSPRFLPNLFARICHTGLGDGQGVHVMHKKEISGLEQRTEKISFVPEFLPEILDGRPEYMSRQLSGKGWKPGLNTIKEKKVKKKLLHWVF